MFSEQSRVNIILEKETVRELKSRWGKNIDQEVKLTPRGRSDGGPRSKWVQNGDALQCCQFLFL